MNSKEKKKLIYKQAKGIGEATLQDALVAALQRLKTPKKRLQRLGTDGSVHRFINLSRTSGKILIGTFHKLTPGAAQLIIDTGTDSDDWPVTPVTAKSKSSQHSEFVQGTLFYGIWRNHVVMHQSSGCRSAQFEDYLSWLLTEFEGSRRVDPIPKAVLLTLSDPVPPALLNRSRMPVKKVRVGTSVGEVETGASTSAKTSFQMSQKLWEHIAGIWSELHAPVPNFKIKPGSGLEDIRAYVELTCAKSKSEAAAGDVLAAFGDALRHSDTADYKLELADGTEITGDSLKKKKDVWFECHDRCPVAQQVFREIVVYFQDLVDSHTIVENEPFSGSK